METLKTSFGKNELTYTLIKRNDLVALYGVSGTYTKEILHLEVCRIQKRKASTFKGKTIPEREAIPSDEQFGKEGSQAYPKRMEKEALLYFDELTETLKAKLKT